MLCGLQRAVKNYDPSEYDNELYLISKRGKGYRGGFDDEYEPILGDEMFTPIIKNRILAIVKVFIDKGIISELELSGIIPKHLQSKTIFEKAIEKIIIKAFTENGDDERSKRIMKSELKELSDHLDKIRAEYDKQEEEYSKLSRERTKTTIDYSKRIYEKDLVNYALFHILKYCDAQIVGINSMNFKIVLRSLDRDTIPLIISLHQDLTIGEWDSLMKMIQGTPQVHFFLNQITILKRYEVGRLYNKNLLFANLMMFRLLKLSS